jgi:hypothetical protein
MAETYWRWHQSDAPAFDADHAWSATWGSEFTADGTAYTCVACDGTGEAAPEVHQACDGTGCRGCDDGIVSERADCDGEGTIDCDRGYSCCASAADLLAYFAARFITAEEMDQTGTVYVFEGEPHGEGIEGEPLVVPTRVLKTLTWTELAEQAKESA